MSSSTTRIFGIKILSFNGFPLFDEKTVYHSKEYLHILDRLIIFGIRRFVIYEMILNFLYESNNTRKKPRLSSRGSTVLRVPENERFLVNLSNYTPMFFHPG